MDNPIDGDWTKGPADGYGTNETPYYGQTSLRNLMTGYLAESMTWAINPDQTTATATLEVRQGVHWALNPASEASRLVNGRELTADDIVYDLNTRMNDPRSWSAGAFPSVKGVQAVENRRGGGSVDIPRVDIYD